MTKAPYTTQLQAGLGMVDETRSLLDLWHDGMEPSSLSQAALESGRFPTMSARRIRNLVIECFAPRLLIGAAKPALHLKILATMLAPREFTQLLFIHACRANVILRDFVREVYWSFYTAGHETISNDTAREFVARAIQDQKTAKPWSTATIRRVASYLTGCCADFGLLEAGEKSVRKILPFRIEARVVAVLAYELHFAGRTDHRIIADQDWALFGLDHADILEEFRRLSLKGLLIRHFPYGASLEPIQSRNGPHLTTRPPRV
ncbi:MAG: BrxA family protein [Planctomycetota bacterium]|nr:BrxA family protein [Planctomycetota bacterium]